MRLLAYLAVLAVVVAGLVWFVEGLRDRGRRRMRSGPGVGELAAGGLAAGGLAAGGLAAGGLGAAHLAEERATLAYGLDRGPGILRLTPSQLVFLADSGRVLVIDRLDIAGVGATRDLPDRTVARPVLVVTTPTLVAYLAVADPEAWVRRLG